MCSCKEWKLNYNFHCLLRGILFFKDFKLSFGQAPVIYHQAHFRIAIADSCVRAFWVPKVKCCISQIPLLRFLIQLASQGILNCLSLGLLIDQPNRELLSKSGLSSTPSPLARFMLRNTWSSLGDALVWQDSLFLVLLVPFVHRHCC